jgi:hypothetical protein
MTPASSITGVVWVAIDVAKATHQVLVEAPDGRRRAMRMANTVADIERLVVYLQALGAGSLLIGRGDVTKQHPISLAFPLNELYEHDDMEKSFEVVVRRYILLQRLGVGALSFLSRLQLNDEFQPVASVPLKTATRISTP